MVKHNKAVPNAHFHKKWQSTSRGPLHLVTWFSQAGKKKSRRLIRAAKAASTAPRPVSRLYPTLHCPTQKHCSKVRLGRGFSLAELKAAKITPQHASAVGIAVDHRRTNKSAESLLLNVARLENYKAKLVILPRKGSKAKAGDEANFPGSTAVQCLDKILMAPTKPSKNRMDFIEVGKINQANAYQKLRDLRNAKKLAGTREKINKEKNANNKT